MNKKQKITFGLIVGLILLLTIGATYAYFSLVVKGNNTANNTVVTAGTLEITYAETNAINATNVIPGWSSENKIVTVTNTGTVTANYNLLWDEINNTFIRKELLMSLSCTSTGTSCSSQDIPVTVNGTTYTYTDEAKVAYFGNDKLIKENFGIEPGVTQTLTLKFYFKETGENQNYNQGKTFTGKLKVSEYKEIVPAGTLSRDWATRTGYKSDHVTITTNGEKISKINFYSDGRTFNGVTPVDVSNENNNSVKLYQVTTTDCPSITNDNGSTWTTPESCYEVNIVADGIIAFPIDSSYLFYLFRNVNMINFNNSIDTSKVTNMYGMFQWLGNRTDTFELDLSDFDTSSVTDMSFMFRYVARNASSLELDLSDLDISKVTDTSSMFEYIGEKSSTWNIGDLSNWDTSSVIDMSYMFRGAGKSVTTWNIGDIKKWDTSSVTDMSIMFEDVGYNATTFELDLSNWDVSNVTNMNDIFRNVGYNATTFELDINNWDTSSVENMKGMFYQMGYNVATFELDLSNFDTSSVTDMQYIFFYAGYNSTTFELNLNNWDTSHVTNMSYMFYKAGNKATYTLDLSSWNVNGVTNHNDFNTGVTTKVIAPTWVS